MRDREAKTKSSEDQVRARYRKLAKETERALNDLAPLHGSNAEARAKDGLLLWLHKLGYMQAALLLEAMQDEALYCPMAGLTAAELQQLALVHELKMELRKLGMGSLEQEGVLAFDNTPASKVSAKLAVQEDRFFRALTDLQLHELLRGMRLCEKRALFGWGEGAWGSRYEQYYFFREFTERLDDLHLAEVLR